MELILNGRRRTSEIFSKFRLHYYSVFYINEKFILVHVHSETQVLVVREKAGAAAWVVAAPATSRLRKGEFSLYA